MQAAKGHADDALQHRVSTNTRRFQRSDCARHGPSTIPDDFPARQQTRNGTNRQTLKFHAVGVAFRLQEVKIMMRLKHWQDALNAVLGAWLVLSPWAVGFSAMNVARLTAVVTGIVIATLALWTLFTDKDYSAWWRKRASH